MMPEVKGIKMKFTREALEKREKAILAPYAAASGDSKGRAYPEEEPEFRTAFQRDRGRVLHTTAFRRLEYKTQVFVNHEGDYYRTRLTHTLEVVNIGRNIARQIGVNEDLVETICLVHDIGHPPFGHSGEVILNELMQGHGGFDHNQQTLRIVTKLENRYVEFPGLNLTYETREGIVKHETEYDVSSVDEIYEPEKNANLEAQIANIADELAYTAHDLDDGLYAGLIKPESLKGMGLWELVRDQLGITGEHLDELSRHRIIRRTIGVLVNDASENTRRQLTELNPQSMAEIQSYDFHIVRHSPEILAMARELKKFLYENMYYHYRVVRMAKKAEQIISELFRAYLEEPRMLPDGVQEKINSGERSLERAVCDYIAGMTDRYALQEYEKLFDPFARP